MKKLDYEVPVLQCITIAAGGGYMQIAPGSAGESGKAGVLRGNASADEYDYSF